MVLRSGVDLRFPEDAWALPIIKNLNGMDLISRKLGVAVSQFEI